MALKAFPHSENLLCVGEIFFVDASKAFKKSISDSLKLIKLSSIS